MKQGHAAGTCRMDMQHGHAAWTAAWTCGMDMQQGHVAWNMAFAKQNGPKINLHIKNFNTP
jgi:hypothetical protein